VKEANAHRWRYERNRIERRFKTVPRSAVIPRIYLGAVNCGNRTTTHIIISAEGVAIRCLKCPEHRARHCPASGTADPKPGSQSNSDEAKNGESESDRNPNPKIHTSIEPVTRWLGRTVGQRGECARSWKRRLY
jgi:hypothetical protein